MSHWWNRLAARACERLHDLAAPAWNEESAVDADEEWEDPIQEAMGRAYDEGAAHGYREAMREMEGHR